MTGSATLKVRSAPSGQTGADISPDDIVRLVHDFYAAVRANARLGPLFEARLAGKWDDHLERMNMFWRSVLLQSGEYGGQPVVKHNGLPDLREDDFTIWIGLFENTVADIFDTETAGRIVMVARRIARSLWLARFGTAFNTPPDCLN